jgi:transcriptional regulator with XRE-family HTH domain
MTILVASGNDNLAKERLAQLIKELRGDTTQREFAKLLGTSYTAIQDWEKQIRLPKEKNLKRIAQLKGWTEEELLHYLFLPDAQPQIAPTDPLELLITQVQTLSLPQMQQLSAYLNAQLSQLQNNQKEGMSCFLNEKQKHNLHLLLRASLRNQSPTEAMAKIGIDPALFTDIFLRNDKKRTVDYDDLEKFSSLCCRVVRWQGDYPPEIDANQTYLGDTAQLFSDLNEGDRVVVDFY